MAIEITFKKVWHENQEKFEIVSWKMLHLRDLPHEIRSYHGDALIYDMDDTFTALLPRGDDRKLPRLAYKKGTILTKRERKTLLQLATEAGTHLMHHNRKNKWHGTITDVI